MYNFDEIIDRQHTNALSTDGFRGYIFHAGPEKVFPYKDDEFVRMWVADMDFSVAPEILDEMRKRIEGLSGRFFIPSHAPILGTPVPLARKNREKVLEILNLLTELCRTPLPFEELLKRVFDHYALRLDFNQYVLVGSTIRSCLSYLCDTGRVSAIFEENRLLWQTVQ